MSVFPGDEPVTPEEVIAQGHAADTRQTEIQREPIWLTSLTPTPLSGTISIYSSGDVWKE